MTIAVDWDVNNQTPQNGRPPDKSLFLKKKIFLNQNICCAYPECDGSFEHPKHRLKQIEWEKTQFFYAENFCLPGHMT